MFREPRRQVNDSASQVVRFNVGLAGQHFKYILLVSLAESEAVQEALFLHPMRPEILLACGNLEDKSFDVTAEGVIRVSEKQASDPASFRSSPFYWRHPKI